jgi:hypothetical protein
MDKKQTEIIARIIQAILDNDKVVKAEAIG